VLHIERKSEKKQFFLTLIPFALDYFGDSVQQKEKKSEKERKRAKNSEKERK
jgi:hypothetical protein